MPTGAPSSLEVMRHRRGSALMVWYVRYARPLAETQDERRPRLSWCSTPSAIAVLNTWVVPPPVQPIDPRCRGSTVADPRLLDDRAGVAAQDAGRRAGRRVDGSARRSGSRTCAASPVPSAAARRSCISLPNYVVRGRSRCCRRTSCSASAAGCARRRSSAATSSSSCSGTGGMGEVWRAEHRLLARDAADQAGAPGSARRAQRGRGAAGRCGASSARRRRRPRLSSPHTIQLFDFGMTQRRARSTT